MKLNRKTSLKRRRCFKLADTRSIGEGKCRDGKKGKKKGERKTERGGSRKGERKDGPSGEKNIRGLFRKIQLRRATEEALVENQRKNGINPGKRLRPDIVGENRKLEAGAKKTKCFRPF